MNGFNIQLTSKLSGVPVHTLRAWEKRYDAVVPARSQTGRRIYEEKHIRKLKLLQKLCSLGHNIGSIASSSSDELLDALNKHGVEIEVTDLTLKPKREDTRQVFNNLAEALDGGRIDLVSSELETLKSSLDLRDLALNTIHPFFKMVEQHVADEKLSPEQAAAIAGILKFHIGKFVYKPSGVNRSQTVVASPEGERREFGILSSALLCVHYEKPHIYLGPNSSVEALVETCRAVAAERVIVGTSDVRDPRIDLTAYIETLLSRVGKTTQVIVEGAGHFDVNALQHRSGFLFLPTINHLDFFLDRKCS